MDRHDRARIHEALGDVHRLEIVDALVRSDRSPGFLAEATGMSPNLVAHHLRVLEAAGVVEVRRSEGDGRRRYVHLLAAGAAAAVDGRSHRADRRVVFVCTHNSARSQLAAALWSRAGGEAASAGTHPAESVHPKAVAVGSAHGLDLRDAAPRLLRPGETDEALVVTVCDRATEELVDPPDLHWSVPDPVRVGTYDAFEAAFRSLYEWVDRAHTRPEEP